jgi:hypothetical protein
MDFLRKIRTARSLFRSDRAGVVAALGLGDRPNAKAVRYLEKTGVSRYLTKGLSDEGPVTSVKAYDLANLHRIVRRLRPKVVIEFGCGFSTLAIAHALKANSERTGKVGRLYVVEAGEKWASNVRGKLLDLSDWVEIRASEPRAFLLGGQLCHVYADLPNARPDFIYLDGPDPRDVIGNINGLTISGLQFACSADPLLYEWGFYPGFQMLVDGRFTNVEFLKKNLKRDYKIKSSALHSNTLFELVR